MPFTIVSAVPWNTLESRLLGQGFQPVFFVEIECLNDGAWRFAFPAEFEAGGTYPCPICANICPCSPPLQNKAFTARTLPFFERHSRPARAFRGLRANEARPWIRRQSQDARHRPPRLEEEQTAAVWE
jgi:hypothetical protein